MYLFMFYYIPSFISRSKISFDRRFHKKSETVFFIKLRKQLILVTFIFSLHLYNCTWILHFLIKKKWCIISAWRLKLRYFSKNSFHFIRYYSFSIQELWKTYLTKKRTYIFPPFSSSFFFNDLLIKTSWQINWTAMPFLSFFPVAVFLSYIEQ